MVENRLRTVLVTGDIRIDADYLESLRRNPLLAPYVAYSPPFGASTSTSIVASRGSASSSKAGLGDIEHDNKNRGDGNFDEDERPAKRKKVASAAAAATTTTKRPTVAVKTLDRIYLDTSQVQLDEKLVSKVGTPLSLCGFRRISEGVHEPQRVSLAACVLSPKSRTPEPPSCASAQTSNEQTP
jgi:hypothetical protein